MLGRFRFINMSGGLAVVAVVLSKTIRKGPKKVEIMNSLINFQQSGVDTGRLFVYIKRNVGWQNTRWSILQWIGNLGRYGV